MAARPTPSSARPVQGDGDGDQQQHPRRPFGAVLITVPDGDGPSSPSLPASSSDGMAAALLDHAGAAGSDDGALMEAEDERPRPWGQSFSLWHATVVVFALAALAAAGYVCLYAGGGAGAAWRLLEAREEEGEDRGGRRFFLLPLYPKPRRGGAAGNLTAATSTSTGNVFPTGCVQPLRQFLRFRNSVERVDGFLHLPLFCCRKNSWNFKERNTGFLFVYFVQ